MPVRIGGTNLFSREEWGAQPRTPQSRPLAGWDQVYLHHDVYGRVNGFTASQSRLKQIESLHNSQGWPGIGYSIWISGDGLAFVGCETQHQDWLHTRGVHTMDQNAISLAICLSGNYQNIHTTPDQDRAVVDIFRHMREQKGNVAMSGHRDVYATACPGNNAYAKVPHYNFAVLEPPDIPDPEPSRPNVVILEP